MISRTTPPAVSAGGQHEQRASASSTRPRYNIISDTDYCVSSKLHESIRPRANIKWLIAERIMRLIIQVRGHIHIALYWTRAHIGVSTPTARGNDPADKLAPAGGAFLGGVLPLVTTRIIPPGGAAWKNSQCSSCSSYRNSAMPPFSLILSTFYCYPDSSGAAGILGSALAGTCARSFCCIELLLSS